MKSYTYTYDALNRITSGIDNTGNYNLSNVTYDKNGNILTLNRQGHTNTEATSFGAMDLLDYNYDSGNKLLKVTDTGNSTYGFKDGANQTTEYTYDGNGNMLSDANKGITSISYNHLHMPTEVVFNSNPNTHIQFVYDAAGIKQRKITNDNGSITTTDYAWNQVYENGNLVQFGHPEGYVEPDGSGGYHYIYSYLDHLGTVRLTYSDYNGDGSIDPSREIVQERNTYPFGLSHKGYNGNINGKENNYQTYLGQEINKELGLDWLTFRYRNYMPEIGRFFGVDPISEEYFSISTFQFAHNSPVWKIELEGLEGKTQNNEIDIPNDEPVKMDQTGTSFMENNVQGTRISRSGRNIKAERMTGNGKVQQTVNIKLGSKVKQNHVTNKSAIIISDNLANSGNEKARITSGYRNPENQARVMFDNLESKGVTNQKNLYGSSGDQVIDVYADAQNLNASLQQLNEMFGGDNSSLLQLSSNDIKSAMTDKINEVGPSRVSKHSSNPNTLNVIDISPSSVANDKQFGKNLRMESRIKKVITPPKDPAFHVEIPQN